MKTIIFLCIAVIPVFVFQNCGILGNDMSFESMGSDDVLDLGSELDDGDDGDRDTDTDYPVIRQLCENTPHLTMTRSVNFAQESQTCAWGQNGNLQKRDTYIQARKEQTYTLPLPNGAVLCDFSLDFPEQDFRFDDLFIMTLNQYVIASSYDFEAIGYAEEDEAMPNMGAWLYNWNAIKGKSWGGNDSPHHGVHCAGEAFGADCIWPMTQQQGEIAMAFPEELTQRIIAQSAIGTKPTFTAITTGDNDDTDCIHLPISFNVTAKYIIPNN